MESVRALMQRALDDNIFPGGVLLVARKSELLFLEAFGLARIDPQRVMTRETVFDLASLTKPLATAVALILLSGQKRLDVDQALCHAVSDFAGTDKEAITIRRLLSHTSGLPDYRPYYEVLSRHPRTERKDLLRAALIKENLVSPPGKNSLYSDVDFMVLGWLVEVVTRTSLDRFVEESIYRPLEIGKLFFVPLNGPLSRRGCQFAATEDCPWRKKVLDGEVHDDNAYALGGVAGHAGLFGAIEAVHGLLQELLDVHSGKQHTGLFHQKTVQTFFQRQSDLGSWALGFDTPSRPGSSSGRYFSDQSVGHLGFTGTSFWMDLVREIVVVLLTNRIHPSRENNKIRAFRPLLHDRVMEALL